MRTYCKTVMVTCAVAALAACQTTQTNKNLHAEARQHIKEIDSVLISKQNTVGADIKTSKMSQYVQGHIVPILFDIGLNTMRSHKAKKFAKPIRETLKEYDYTSNIKEEFNLALGDSGLEGAGDLKVLRYEQPGFRGAYIRQSDADAVMFVDVKYAFTPKFDSLNLTSQVMMFPVNPALSPYKETPDKDHYLEISDNIYRNQFVASISTDLGEEGKKSDHAAVWADMSEEELTGKLQDAATQLAGYIASDLRADEAEIIVEDPDDEDREYLIEGPLDEAEKDPVDTKESSPS